MNLKQLKLNKQIKRGIILPIYLEKDKNNKIREIITSVSEIVCKPEPHTFKKRIKKIQMFIKNVIS